MTLIEALAAFSGVLIVSNVLTFVLWRIDAAYWRDLASEHRRELSAAAIKGAEVKRQLTAITEAL